MTTTETTETEMTPALAAELDALRDVADVVNDAFGGLAIGASVEVVMAPVRRALDRLYAVLDAADAAE